MFSAGCCYFLCQRRGDFGSNPSCATGKSSYLSGPLFFLLWKISRLNQTIPRPPSSPSTVWFHEKNRNHSLSLRPFGGIKPVWKELPSMVKLSVCYTNFSIQRFKVHWSIRELQVLESLRLFLPTAILSLWNESLCFLLKEFQEFSKGVGGTRRGLAVPLSLCVNPALKVNQI